MRFCSVLAGLGCGLYLEPAKKIRPVPRSGRPDRPVLFSHSARARLSAVPQQSHPHLVIPSGADRLLFLAFASCECVGLRSRGISLAVSLLLGVPGCGLYLEPANKDQTRSFRLSLSFRAQSAQRGICFALLKFWVPQVSFLHLGSSPRLCACLPQAGPRARHPPFLGSLDIHPPHQYQIEFSSPQQTRRIRRTEPASPAVPLPDCVDCRQPNQQHQALPIHSTSSRCLLLQFVSPAQLKIISLDNRFPTNFTLSAFSHNLRSCIGNLFLHL